LPDAHAEAPDRGFQDNITMVARFYCPRPLAAQALAELPPAAAHHARRVLRLRVGDAVVLFDGCGGEYRGEIVGTGGGVRVRLGERCGIERESPLEMTLAQALPAGDRMDWVIQKAAELGVARIQPLACSRSVVRLSAERAARRLAHWRQVAISACEQCGRNRLPEIAPMLDLRQWLDRLPQQDETHRLLLTPHGGQRPRTLAIQRRFVLLVGPEGGLAQEEIASALQAGFVELSLGPRILRTETAGPAALAALGALYGDI
jgi:16S rRNA (uracil1498-N3)-methyltransferase